MSVGLFFITLRGMLHPVRPVFRSSDPKEFFHHSPWVTGGFPEFFFLFLLARQPTDLLWREICSFLGFKPVTPEAPPPLFPLSVSVRGLCILLYLWLNFYSLY